MTNLSAADKAKQDAARENDGKFGPQLRGELEGGTGILGGNTAFQTVRVRAEEAAGSIRALGDRLAAAMEAEKDWAASTAAVRVLEAFPGAESFDYRSVLGKVTTLSIRSGVEEVGFYAAPTGISSVQTRSSDLQQFKTLFDLVDMLKEVDLEAMTEQGASVEPLRAGEHLVTVDVKDVLDLTARRLEPVEAFIPKDREQLTSMAMAIEGMPETIGSFSIVKDDDGTISVQDIRDLDGNRVSEHMETEVEEVFWDAEDEYAEYIGQTVDVPETLAAWRKK